MIDEISFINHFLFHENRKKRCWACGFQTSIKWGKQGDKQRYKCKNCEILYCEQRKDVRQRNRFVWFKKWILERQTLKVLSSYSQRTLQTLFYEYLAQAPVLKIQNNRVFHMRMDGTYFKQFCLISYQDHHSNLLSLSGLVMRKDMKKSKRIYRIFYD